MQKVTEFEVVDLGIQYPGYFQGFGCTFTRYDHCVYGIGANPAEALDDCLEIIAQMDVDAEDLAARIREIEGEPPTTPVAEDEAYYHIGVRWNVADEIESATREQLADELAAACEYTEDWQITTMDDLRDRVRQIRE